jgi:hypothetical protein
VRSIFRLLALVAAFLAMSGAAALPQASAQTPEPVESAFFDVVTSLTGFETGAVRTFSSDSLDEGATASPDATVLASPVTGSEISGLSRVTTAALQFETDANATTAMAKLQTEIQGENPVTALLVGELGDKNTGFTLEDEAGTPTASAIVIQTGDQVIVVLVEGVGADTETLAVALAQQIVESEAGAGEPQFAPDGTSTGGLWDRLPAADDPSLADLPVVEDIDLRPTEG